MSSSKSSLLAPLRNRLDRFLASPFYIIGLMMLSIISHLFSLELPVYTAFVLVGIYTAVLGKDLLPLTPLFPFFYISISLENNPGHNPQSVFYGTTGTYLYILAGLFGTGVLWYIIRNHKRLLKAKGSLLLGLCLLAGSYLLSGIGTEKYTGVVVERNLLFAAMQVAALLLPYWLLRGGVDWEDTRPDYLAWTGVAVAGSVLSQVLYCYAAREVIVDGAIVREQIYSGWGMYNNMGFMIAMGIPFAFYLAAKYRRSWLGLIIGTALLIGVMLTCSRTSLLFGTLIYCLSLVLMLRHCQNRRRNMILLGSVCAAGVLVLLVFHSQLLHLFSKLLSLGANPSSRDVFFREGLKLFAQAPIFGSSFYSPGYVPWDFAEIIDVSLLIPPRWHNTLLQLLVSCGTVGVCAYIFHRFQTVRLMLRRRSLENTFLSCALGLLLLCSLFDCHFFNIGPTLVYSAALAFAEFGIDKINVTEESTL